MFFRAKFVQKTCNTKGSLDHKLTLVFCEIQETTCCLFMFLFIMKVCSDCSIVRKGNKYEYQICTEIDSTLLKKMENKEKNGSRKEALMQS